MQYIILKAKYIPQQNLSTCLQFIGSLSLFPENDVWNLRWKSSISKTELEYNLSKNIKNYRRNFIFHLIYMKVCLLYENILLQISFWEFSTKRNKSVHSDVSPGNRMQFERTSEVQKKPRASECLICVRSSHSEMFS